MRSSRLARRWAAGLTALPLIMLSSAIGPPPAQAAAATSATSAASGQYWVQRLELSKVWKITRGAGVTVAVVDSGVPPTPNLRGRLLKGVDLASHGPNGQADTGESTTAGPYSHGQEMAELIAGAGGAGLTQGIAPDASILPVKVGDSGSSASSTTEDAGIRWAVDHGATVVNASFGIDGASCQPGDQAAVKYAFDHDVVVVASAGDEAGPVGSPASCPGALAVAGVTSNGSNWSSSAFGAEVDVANFATKIPFSTLTGNPVTGNGTSSAAAFTSGEVALLRAAFPKDTAREIITRLLYGIDPLSKTPLGQRVDDHIGYGVPAVYSELTAKVPASFPNPVYDAWTKALGAPATGSSAPVSAGASAGASTGASSGASTGASSTGSPPTGSAPSSAGPAASGAGSGSGSHTGVIIILVVVVLLLIAVAVVLSRRSQQRRPSGGPPGPPPGY